MQQLPHKQHSTPPPAPPPEDLLQPSPPAVAVPSPQGGPFPSSAAPFSDSPQGFTLPRLEASDSEGRGGLATFSSDDGGAPRSQGGGLAFVSRSPMLSATMLQSQHAQSQHALAQLQPPGSPLMLASSALDTPQYTVPPLGGDGATAHVIRSGLELLKRRSSRQTSRTARRVASAAATTYGGGEGGGDGDSVGGARDGGDGAADSAANSAANSPARSFTGSPSRRHRSAYPSFRRDGAGGDGSGGRDTHVQGSSTAGSFDVEAVMRRLSPLAAGGASASPPGVGSPALARTIAEESIGTWRGSPTSAAGQNRVAAVGSRRWSRAPSWTQGRNRRSGSTVRAAPAPLPYDAAALQAEFGLDPFAAHPPSPSKEGPAAFAFPPVAGSDAAVAGSVTSFPAASRGSAGSSSAKGHLQRALSYSGRASADGGAGAPLPPPLEKSESEPSVWRRSDGGNEERDNTRSGGRSARSVSGRRRLLSRMRVDTVTPTPPAEGADYAGSGPSHRSPPPQSAGGESLRSQGQQPSHPSSGWPSAGSERDNTRSLPTTATLTGAGGSPQTASLGPTPHSWAASSDGSGAPTTQPLQQLPRVRMTGRRSGASRNASAGWGAALSAASSRMETGSTDGDLSRGGGAFDGSDGGASAPPWRSDAAAEGYGDEGGRASLSARNSPLAGDTRQVQRNASSAQPRLSLGDGTSSPYKQRSSGGGGSPRGGGSSPRGAAAVRADNGGDATWDGGGTDGSYGAGGDGASVATGVSANSAPAVSGSGGTHRRRLLSRSRQPRLLPPAALHGTGREGSGGGGSGGGGGGISSGGGVPDTTFDDADDGGRDEPPPRAPTRGAGEERSTGIPSSAPATEKMYVPTSALQPLANPDAALRASLGAMAGGALAEGWSKQFEALTALRRLAVHHGAFLGSSPAAVHDIVTLGLPLVDSLRSSLAKGACLAFEAFFAAPPALSRAFDSELEPIAVVLVRRAADTNEFIASAASAALCAMVDNCSEQRVLAAVLSAANSKNGTIRLGAAVWLERAAARAMPRIAAAAAAVGPSGGGSGGGSLGSSLRDSAGGLAASMSARDTERLVATAMRYVGDGAPGVRHAGTRTLARLLQGGALSERALGRLPDKAAARVREAARALTMGVDTSMGSLGSTGGMPSGASSPLRVRASGRASTAGAVATPLAWGDGASSGPSSPARRSKSRGGTARGARGESAALYAASPPARGDGFDEWAVDPDGHQEQQYLVAAAAHQQGVDYEQQQMLYAGGGGYGEVQYADEALAWQQQAAMEQEAAEAEAAAAAAMRRGGRSRALTHGPGQLPPMRPDGGAVGGSSVDVGGTSPLYARSPYSQHPGVAQGGDTGGARAVGGRAPGARKSRAPGEGSASGPAAQAAAGIAIGAAIASDELDSLLARVGTSDARERVATLGELSSFITRDTATTAHHVLRVATVLATHLEDANAKVQGAAIVAASVLTTPGVLASSVLDRAAPALVPGLANALVASQRPVSDGASAVLDRLCHATPGAMITPLVVHLRSTPNARITASLLQRIALILPSAHARRPTAALRHVLPAVFALLSDAKPDTKTGVQDVVLRCADAVGVQAVLDAAVSASLPKASMDKLMRILR